jgi:hypothetical protein
MLGTVVESPTVASAATVVVALTFELEAQLLPIA